jgi:hypothetical protein
MGRADRRVRLQIALRSLRWRVGASLVMLAVAVVGVSAGTFGPIYLQGADQSVLQATLRTTTTGDTGLSLLADDTTVTVAQMERAAAQAPRTGAGAAQYGPMILTVDYPVTSVARSGQPYGADLIARTGICGHLSFAAGSCPTSGGGVAVSTRSAHALGLALGDQAVLALHGGGSRRFTVSGLYRTPNSQAEYWWGVQYFAYGLSFSGLGHGSFPTLDDFIVSQPTALSLPTSKMDPLLGQLPLLGARLRTGGVGPLTQSLARYHHQAQSLFRVETSTPLQQTLDAASSDEHTTGTIVAVVLAQLVLLALIVLYFVAARTAESREPDVRLAELRGFSASGKASVALLEPVVVLLAALPLGVLIAWVAAQLVAPHVFSDGVRPTLTLWALGAAVLTFVGGVAATVIAARGLMLRPAVGSRRGGRSHSLGLAVDAVAIAVAAAAFVEVVISGVSAGHRTDPLAALSPGLLAFGLGVAGARLLPVLARTLLPSTRYSRRIGAAIASRRVARLPELSRHVVVLSMSVGLATFALYGWSTASHNRSVRSQFEVGATRVLTVNPDPGVDFLPAVRRADPSGHSAMAVVFENASDGETLAVDSARLPAVVAWPPGLSRQSLSTLARELGGHAASPVLLPGRSLRATVDLAHAIEPAPQLFATVFDDSYDTESTLSLGNLTVSRHDYQATLTGACGAACHLVSLDVTWAPAGNAAVQSVTVPMVVTALATERAAGVWTTLPAGLHDAARWRSTAGSVSLSGEPDGLSVRATVQAAGGPTSFGPADVPTNVPAVVSASGSTLGVGLDGATINLHPIATVPAVPGAGSGAALVDLALAERLQSGPELDTTYEVWLAPGASAGIVGRLRSEGIALVSVQTGADRDAELAGTGISLAYSFFLLAALAAGVLAVGATIFALVAAARRRVSELAALQAVGIRRSSLRRSLMAEQGMVVGFGVVLGLAAGVVAAVVALPSVPEFVSSMTGPPLDYGLPWGTLALLVAALVILMAATVALTARVVLGQASMDQVGRDQS